MNATQTETPTFRTSSRLWLAFASITTLAWGVWGALIELPEKAAFPATLGYAVWALTMMPCALAALGRAGWRLDRSVRSAGLGSLVGLLGAGGQIILFQSLRTAPAYLVFPVVSLYPVLTVALSAALLKERASRRAAAGIAAALAALPMLAYQPPGAHAASGYLWLAGPVAVFAAWGLQAYFMKCATRTMSEESIFFYMTAAAVALIPFAVWMTDFSKPVNWGIRGPWLAALIQVLNSVGALTLVYALRHGKAIIVVPMTSLAPVLTILLSLALYGVMPGAILAGGMALASVAIYLMAE